eukprot:3066616-Prymnesium_polylepis.1
MWVGSVWVCSPTGVADAGGPHEHRVPQRKAAHDHRQDHAAGRWGVVIQRLRRSRVLDAQPSIEYVTVSMLGRA